MAVKTYKYNDKTQLTEHFGKIREINSLSFIMR